MPLARVLVVGPEESLADLAVRLTPAADGMALVVDQGRLLGMVGTADVARAMQLATVRRTSGDRSPG